MRTVISLALVGLLSLGSAASVMAMSEEEHQKTLEEMKNYRFKTITTPEGLHFNIPEDMPVEKKDGLVAPISFDEYFYFKFKKMEEKMSEVDKKIDRLNEMIVALQKQMDKMMESSKEKPVEKPVAVTAL